MTKVLKDVCSRWNLGDLSAICNTTRLFCSAPLSPISNFPRATFPRNLDNPGDRVNFVEICARRGGGRVFLLLFLCGEAAQISQNSSAIVAFAPAGTRADRTGGFCNPVLNNRLWLFFSPQKWDPCDPSEGFRTT